MKVTPSGCQQWRKRVLSSIESKIAYASTLSVCFYDLKTQQLESIFTFEDVPISCVEWEKSKQNLVAIGLQNKKCILWDQEK